MSVCELVLSPVIGSGDVVSGVMAVRRCVCPSMTSMTINSAESPVLFSCTRRHLMPLKSVYNICHLYTDGSYDMAVKDFFYSGVKAGSQAGYRF